MRGLMNRRKVRDQFADRRFDLSDRFIHLDAVGTETMPGGIDNVEIEGDEDGPEFGRAPHPVEHGVDALHARHMLVEALPVRRPRVVDCDLAARPEHRRAAYPSLVCRHPRRLGLVPPEGTERLLRVTQAADLAGTDRKSTRLNS